MTQISTNAGAARGPAPSDSPDLMFVIRHYRWLIIVGTLLGTLVGFGIYWYIRKTAPQYTASNTFQVVPQRATLDKNINESTGTPEEINRLIKRQGVLLKTDMILDQALMSEAFTQDYRQPKNPNARSRFMGNRTTEEAKRILQRAIEVQPITGSDVFRIAVTTDDNVEAANIVNAVSQVYVDRLRQDDKEKNSERLREMRDSERKLEDEIRTLEAALADFRRTANIAAVTPRHQIEIATLSGLKADLLELEINVASAQASFENIKKQVEAGTLQLSTEMEAFVENDPQIRSLESRRIDLQSEKEVQATISGPDSRQVRALDVRLAATIRMAEEKREELRAKARLRMQDNAQSAYTGLIARAQDMRARVEEKERQVKDLDNLLVQYQSRQEELKGKQEVLNNIRKSVLLFSLETGTDYARIRRLGGVASAPPIDDISYPKPAMFILPGFVIGLGLSFGLGYLLELTNTRVRTPRDITRSVQLPLLGFVPDQEDDTSLAGDISTAIRTSPMSMMAESFRQVRGRVAAQADGKPISTLLVASIAPSGGASTIASNLANGMALNDLRVLLVDANFYRPSLGKTYKNIPTTGFSDVLVNPGALDASIVPCTDLPRLHLLGAGNKPTIGATELLESKAFREILDQLKKRYDVIIFDGAPLSLVGDSISLASRVDGVVAVVRAGVVSRGTVGRVRDQLRQVRANLLGVVLNAAQTHGAGYFKQNYRTFYEYAGQTERTVASK